VTGIFFSDTRIFLWTVHEKIKTQALCSLTQAFAEFRLQCEKVLKGKAVLLQAWSGPEGSRKLRFPNFMTMAQVGG